MERFAASVHLRAAIQRQKGSAPSVTDGPHLLTVADVASLCRVSRATVYKLAQSGKLPGFKVTSGAIRFAPGDVEAFLRGSESSAALGSKER